MMNHFASAIGLIAGVTLSAGTCLAQINVQGGMAPDDPLRPSVPQEDAGLRVITMSPMAPAIPALRYRFRFSPADELSGNAAVGYLQVVGAPSVAPEVFGRATEMFEMKFADLPVDQAQKSIDETFGGVWNLLETAARRDTCFWETPIKDQGVGVLLPELGRLRQLARIIALKARVEIKTRKFDDAVKTIRCGFELGQDVGRGPTLIQALVGAAIVQLMFEQVELLIQQPGAPNLYWPLSELRSPMVNVAEAVRNEQAILDFTVPEIRELESGALTPAAAADAAARVNARMGSIRSEFGMVNPDAGARLEAAATAVVQYPRASRWLRAQGYTAEQVQAFPVSYVTLRYSLSQFRRISDDFVKWSSLPYSQAAVGLNEADSEMDRISRGTEAQPFIQLLPAVRRSMQIGALLERRHAMLRAIEAIRAYAAAHDGKPPASLADLATMPIPRDAYTGEPFVYRIEGDTIILAGASISPEAVKTSVREYRIHIAPSPPSKPAP